MKEIIDHLSMLISYPSITPHDADCQSYMIDILTTLGFTCQRFDNPPVANFFARLGTQSPLLVFAGHTDVVPVGDLSKWHTDPFVLHEDNGLLYGRGTADMKGSLACMLVAAKQFIQLHPQFAGSLGFLITSGEEGNDYLLGTPYVMEQLRQQGITLDYCIVGEPSSTTKIGDTIKNGRRGSLTATLQLHGKQGHVAYPHLAINPIHSICPALVELIATHWDEGNNYFPPTSLQITHIQSGGHAGNIIPGELSLQLNFRYSTEQTDTSLKEAVETCFARHGIKPSINWQLSGKPFLTSEGLLLESCIDVIHRTTQQKPTLSTNGGTSDGRFIAPFGVEVIELGPVNTTIHQVNECVAAHDLDMLTQMYYLICEKLLT